MYCWKRAGPRWFTTPHLEWRHRPKWNRGPSLNIGHKFDTISILHIDIISKILFGARVLGYIEFYSIFLISQEWRDCTPPPSIFRLRVYNSFCITKFLDRGWTEQNYVPLSRSRYILPMIVGLKLGILKWKTSVTRFPSLNCSFQSIEASLKWNMEPKIPEVCPV